MENVETNIRKTLEQITPMSDQDWKFFEDKLQHETFPKNAIILKKGKVENYLYFIGKGILRAWVEKEEKEITFEFSFENTFYSSYTSFLTRSPSEYNVQSITKMEIWKISFDDLQEVYRETLVGQLIGRKAAENLYVKKSKRELALLSKSSEVLYLDLFEDQPRLITQIPLKYLASYIGITPQALSRIRKRIS